MSMELSRLRGQLTGDEWRKKNPFSRELETASQVINHPYSTDSEREIALGGWLRKYQPCTFGKLAARDNQIHYCFVTDADIDVGDERVSEIVAESRQLWKARGLRQGRERHGLLICVCSPRIMYAAPDANLREFSMRMRDLCGWRIETDEKGNDITWETLYFRNSIGYLKFSFSVDYFAAAGDGRWWTDHRIPGGIAFTANSLGHMLYTMSPSQPDLGWGLKMAMLTIEGAKETSEGRATWLTKASQLGPLRGGNARSEIASLEKLAGEDFSVYEGYLHTDHSIRQEFFNNGAEPSMKAKPWLMDFSYIYKEGAEDHRQFVLGEPIEEAEVFKEIGPPADWRLASAVMPARQRSQQDVAEIDRLLQKIAAWNTEGT